MQRRLYENRTNIAVCDLLDQYEGKYVAFLDSATFGIKASVAFDQMDLAPGVVSFVRVYNPDAVKPRGEIVASVPVESVWGVIARELLVLMSGKEWEKFTANDNENRAAVLKEAFGDGIAARILMTPDGKLFPLKHKPEDDEAVTKTLADTESPKHYNDSASYR